MDEEKYPEYYRKPVEYVKGSNYDVPEPFKIGNLSLNTLKEKRNEIKDREICFEYRTNWERPPSFLLVTWEENNRYFEIQ